MSFEQKEFESIFSIQQQTPISELEFINFQSSYDHFFHKYFNPFEKSDLLNERFPTTKENESELCLYNEGFFQKSLTNEFKSNFDIRV